MADKALLLGINTYKYVQSLRGCEEDVNTMFTLLTDHFDFDERNIHQLKSAAVTRSTLLQELNWLFRDVRGGDRVVLHFSGHGSFTVDQDQDEDDGKDEILCLYDMDPQCRDTQTFFTDDEIYAWTTRKPEGVQLLIVMDNCHSGTGTRLLMAPAGTRSLLGSSQDLLVIPRDMEQRSDQVRSTNKRDLLQAAENDPNNLVLARFFFPPQDIFIEASQRTTSRSLATRKLNHLLLTACQADQVAADAHIDGKFQGAFTYHLNKLLRASGRSITREALRTSLQSALRRAGFQQVPQVEAEDLTQALFTLRPASSSAAAPNYSTEEVQQKLNQLEELLRKLRNTQHRQANQGRELTSEEIQELLDRIQKLIEGLDKNKSRQVSQSQSDTDDVQNILDEIEAIISGKKKSVALAGHTRDSEQPRKVLVYIHGIGVDQPGYSQDWFKALSKYVPSLKQNVVEVFWGDIVNSNRDLRNRSSDVNSQVVKESLKLTIRERQLQEIRPMAADLVHPAARDMTDDIQEFFRLPQMDDFVRYLSSDSVREECIARFTYKVWPLLESGHRVEIISHSWGTVVAYEGLRQLAREQAQYSGRVAHFFTVGAALSMSFVKDRLLSDNQDGAKPAIVERWINLDAKGDLVGGSLRANGMSITDEFLELDPSNPQDPNKGCQRNFLGRYPLVCAHSSYFQSYNTKVNQNIFGTFIDS